MRPQCGTDSPEALGDVQQLAGSLEDVGDLDGAAAQYERALGLKLRQLGCENIDEVAEMQYSLACLHIGWGHYARARELLLECVGSFKRNGGPRLAVAHESLAHVEEREGRISFALRRTRESRQSLGKMRSAAAGRVARNLDLQADLSEHLRLRVEANLLRKKARHLQAAAEDQAAGGLVGSADPTLELLNFGTSRCGRFLAPVIANDQGLIGVERPAAGIPEGIRHRSHRIAGRCGRQSVGITRSSSHPPESWG